MQDLFSLIEQYDIITIFRHTAADSDALGSQFGLKQWIQDTYPDKQVYALGVGIGSAGSHFPAIDTCSDEVVSSSLAIILDTANASRIDDERWRTALYRIKVDHHIYVETYADLEIIEDYKGATCEILADLFEKHGCTLSKQCAEYLYSGMIADTLQFSINATTPQMLRTAAYLVEAGVDVAKINEENFSKSLKEFRYETYIRQNCHIIDDCLAYAKISKAEYEGFGLTLNEAKEKVYALGRVHEFSAWALFVEIDQDEQGTLYNGSLRSRDKMINDIANVFKGGGHRYACGVKNLHEEDIERLLAMLLERVK